MFTKFTKFVMFVLIGAFIFVFSTAFAGCPMVPQENVYYEGGRNYQQGDHRFYHYGQNRYHGQNTRTPGHYSNHGVPTPTHRVNTGVSHQKRAPQRRTPRRNNSH
jgi:hypothetical protein